MGGSVARTLARRAPRTTVFGIDPDDDCAALASRDGVVRARTLADCDPDGAVVVFAVPLDVTAGLVRDTASTWSRAVLATDVCSLKVPVIDAALRGSPCPAPVRDALAEATSGPGRPHPILAEATSRPGHPPPAPARASAPHRSNFVGAHPMCGSERSGYAAARAGLFDGADVWLCPAHHDAPLARAEAFWRLLGARHRTVPAEEHDRLMAWASHLPQLLASALAGTLDDAGITRDVLGPGGRDMTRLAGSSTSMWVPLLEAARERDARALAALEQRIGSVRRMLDEGDLTALVRFMEEGRRWTSSTD